MPRFSTIPTLYDDLLQLDSFKLMHWGYLKPDQIKSGIITWRSNGEEIASISIRVDTVIAYPVVTLNYLSNGESAENTIRMASVPSNLGKGSIWYFYCPLTNKRCRKLYLYGNNFIHREAIRGAMYLSQTYSSNIRNMIKIFDTYKKTENHYEQIHKKHFKKMYAGKLTKRYMKLMGELDSASAIGYDDIERLMIK